MARRLFVFFKHAELNNYPQTLNFSVDVLLWPARNE